MRNILPFAHNLDIAKLCGIFLRSQRNYGVYPIKWLSAFLMIVH
jgi:hypothetical protein